MVAAQSTNTKTNTNKGRALLGTKSNAVAWFGALLFGLMWSVSVSLVAKEAAINNKDAAAVNKDAAALDYHEQWGPQVGSPLPLLSADDQQGSNRTFESLAGERGLLLFLIRSADW